MENFFFNNYTFSKCPFLYEDKSKKTASEEAPSGAYDVEVFGLNLRVILMSVRLFLGKIAYLIQRSCEL